MAIKMLAFLFFNCLIGVLGERPPPPGRKKFTINFASSVYACADEVSLAFVDPSDLQTTRLNESFASMTGSIVFNTAFDYSTKIEIAVKKEYYNDNYDTVFTREICSVCEEMNNPESHYKALFKYCGFPDECPFDAGSYKIIDVVTDTTHIPCNSASAGSYLVEVTFYKDDGNCKDEKEFLGCIKLDLVIEPL